MKLYEMRRTAGLLVVFLMGGSALPIHAQRDGGRGDLPPPGQAVISMPSRSEAGNYTVQWSFSGSAPYSSLQQSVDGGDWQNISIPANTYSKTFSNQPPGAYSYRVQVCAPGPCAPWSDAKSVGVGPTTAESYQDELYVGLKGDINSDGLFDYYITAPLGSPRLVGDFLLIQQSDRKFDVVSPSAAQRDVAEVWPHYMGNIVRLDMSLDRHADFIIEDIERQGAIFEM